MRMDAKLEPLFTPWKIGNCDIKNRIVLTSMGGTNLLGWMEKNHFDKDGAKFIMEVAKTMRGWCCLDVNPSITRCSDSGFIRIKKMYEDLKAWMPKVPRDGSKIIRSADRRVRTVFHGQRADGDTLHKQISEGGFQTVYGSG